MDIQLFDGTRFVMPSDEILATLDPAKVTKIFAIRDAADSLNAAEREMQETLTERARALKANSDAEKNRDRPSSVDAARQFIKQQAIDAAAKR